mgnify:CR=1 FL=1
MWRLQSAASSKHIWKRQAVRCSSCKAIIWQEKHRICLAWWIRQMHGLLMYSSVCTATPTAAAPAVQKRLSMPTIAVYLRNLPPCIQSQIVQSLGTVIVAEGAAQSHRAERYHNARRSGGNSFIDNDNDAALLTNNADDFARAIARGITDFEGR